MKALLPALVIIALLVSPLARSGQSRPDDKQFAAAYDAFIAKTLERFPEIPAVAVVVVRGDKPVFMRAYGVADRETGRRATTDTLFYIASSTKSFMGLAAGLLDRDGLIKLDDPVTKYAPGIAFKTAIPATVTVRDLLTHTSGLRNSPLTFRMAYSGEVDDRDMESVLAEGTSYTDADHGKYAYTNLGYNIYGLLLRLTLKKRWQDVLEDRVFSPLKMRRTSAYISKGRAAKYAMAEGYLWDPTAGAVIRSPLVKADNNMQSAGGMVTTVEDLSRWLRVNINNGRLDGKQVIPAEVMTAVHTGQAPMQRKEPPFAGPGRYGIGWMIGKYHDADLVWHNGGFPGWSSHISYMPGERIGVAVLINESTAGSFLGDVLAANAYDRLLGTGKTEETYAGAIDDLVRQYEKGKRSRTDAALERKKRPSQLSRPVESYVGRYTSPLMGSIEIAAEQGTLTVRMGNIYVLSTPYTQSDTIRVEMVPGQGETIKFEVDAAGKASALTYDGVRFGKK
jgi:CubicO group peptidase (beta-lactamase class C family)